MKKIVILGSTGSIGRQAIEVIQRHQDKFKIVGLTAGNNVGLLIEQISLLKPKYAAILHDSHIERLQSAAPSVKILSGEQSLVEMAAAPEADLILNALVGAAGLPATLAAIKADKVLALANKESLVAAGDLVKQTLLKSKAKLVPVDSEHSAVFQCLLGEDQADVSRVILTASGGPFRGRKWDTLDEVTPTEAATHPRWNMGKKISVDSATLMNKGLEVIEAHYLFDMPYERIDIIIHPQSIVHSLVEFADGSMKAHLGPTDMRVPIQYALTYPRRYISPVDNISLASLGALNFASVNIDEHPCLRIALDAARQSGSYPAVMSAANEVAVDAFLRERIKFTEIGNIIETVIEQHQSVPITTLADFKEVDSWSRRNAGEIIYSHWRKR